MIHYYPLLSKRIGVLLYIFYKLIKNLPSDIEFISVIRFSYGIFEGEIEALKTTFLDLNKIKNIKFD